MSKDFFRNLAPLLLLLVLGFPAVAEPGPHSAPPPPVRSGRNNRSLVPMGKKLALTNDQMKRLRVVNKSYPAGPDREAAMMKIFTPEQRAKYQAYLDGKRQHRH